MTTAPISDLAVLLRSLQPLRQPGTYVFTTVPDARLVDPGMVVASIREPEGLAVLARLQAGPERAGP